MTSTIPIPATGTLGPARPATRSRFPDADAWRARAQRVWRGPETDPRWARPALLTLLAATAVLYIAGLAASGWANAFYSAAVQAGSSSWKAFFFGSSDAGNFITVDKPPAALWVMGISARIFGVNSWSLLVPEALEGVAAVGVLYATVKRWFSPAAGLIAGAALALTPVATLMFRFNNPDALLVLLLVLGAYATTRALEDAGTRWLLAAGAFVGAGFLAKMMQTFLVVPAFALVYLLAAPTGLRRRILQVLGAGAAMLVAAGWWVAAVELWPASSRPYIGGSRNNSIVNLIFGYNGFGRLNGKEAGSVGGGGFGAGGGGRWGATGILRMFNGSFGSQISWLIPAALLFGVAGLWASWRAPRTDRTRAAVLLWGGWLVVTGVTFSLAKGIIHEYYTVALAPAVGALVGIGAVGLWRQRAHVIPRGILGAALALTAIWSFVLLRRSPDWHPWLRVLVLAAGLTVAATIVALPYLKLRHAGRIGVGLAGAGLVTALAAPAAYAFDTASTAHTGALPTAGPSVVGGRGGPGGFFRARQANPGQLPNFGNGQNGFPGFGNGNGQGGTDGRGAFPGGGGFGGGAFGGGGRGGIGGLLDAGAPSAELVAALKAGAKSYTWVAAAVGSNSAAGIQLATKEPVMAIGGFNGTDPAPSLARFQQYVRAGKIHYFIGSGGGGFRGFGGRGGGSSTGSSSVSSQITSWVEQNFTAKTIGGVTVYDLSTASGGTGA